MKYGILCAIPAEIELLHEDIQVKQSTTIAMRDFCEGELYGQDVVLALSRIGKVAAAATVSIMIEHFGVDCIIFSGTAGGVGDTLHVGDIVIGDRLLQHDFFTGVDYFRIPILDKTWFETDYDLSIELRAGADRYFREELADDISADILKKFHIDKPRAVTGAIASGDQFICDSKEQERLKNQIENLQCVEMEGAAAAQVCYEFSVPCAVLRVISDSANEDSNVDFEAFCVEAACRFVRGCIRSFLTHV